MRLNPIFHRRYSPPDYTHRRVKLRLFVAVAAIMFVLAVIERARDPQTWQWFLSASTPVERFDNRLAEHGSRTAADPAGTFIVAASQSDSAAAAAAAFDPVERAWKQGWNDVVSRLPTDEQGLLFELLHAAARRPVSPLKIEAAGEMVEHVGRLWSDYQAAAFQSIAELKDDDRARWIDVLRQVNDRFSSEVRPALEAIVDHESLNGTESAAVNRLQTTLVEWALAQVQDDTVIFRPAEREIWFHELARVNDADEDQLEKESLGRVTYLQLWKQPADYRGKVVTVSGTVRLAYRADATANYLGVKEYFVYWIYPAGGPDSPLIVYALGTPPGFPPVANQNVRGKQSSGKLREDVIVTGIFLKRSAYSARGGTYTAPLLIAKAPQWRPTPAAPARIPFTPLQLGAMTIAALLLAVCITAVIWKRTRHTHQTRLHQRSGGLVSVGNLTVGPTPEEAIRELERQARAEGSG